MVHKALSILGGVLLVAASASPGAEAVDRGSIGTLGPDNPYIEQEYTPLAGQYPGAGAHPFAYFRPPVCRTVTYCDSVELSIEYPEHYLKEVFFGYRMTLSWENPRTEDNPSGNDIDLFLWGDDGEAAGGPSSKCGSPGDENCDNIHPEVVTVTEPLATIDANDDGDYADEGENDPQFFTIVNHTGVNTGYKLTVEWFTFDIEDAPTFERPGGQSEQRTPEPDPTPAVFGPTQPQAETAETDTEPRKILVPGPDGELVEVELPLLAAGQRLQTDADGGLSPWIPAGIVGGLVALVMGWIVIARLRREGDTL